jgi:hypothetical protein
MEIAGTTEVTRFLMIPIDRSLLVHISTPKALRQVISCTSQTVP